MPSRRRGVQVTVAVLALAFIALLVYGVVAQAPNTGIDDALATGRRAEAPSFDLKALTRGHPGRFAGLWSRASADGSVALDELRGTPLVVNFWASWCSPCRDEAPVLQRGWISARNRGVLFLGVDIQDATEDANRFIDRYGTDYPHLRDPDKSTGREWGITGIPETYFVDRRGKVVGHVIGTVSAVVLKDGVAAARADRLAGARRGGDQRPTR